MIIQPILKARVHEKWLHFCKKKKLIHAADGWSDWDRAMLSPLAVGYNLEPRLNQVDFICSSIRNAFPDHAQYCGVHEWQTRRPRQPDRVVYVGSTCRCSTKPGPLLKRILEYCRNGSHKKKILLMTPWAEGMSSGFALRFRRHFTTAGRKVLRSVY